MEVAAASVNVLRRQDQDFTSINQRQEKRVNIIEKKGYYLTTGYFAFQVILLNVISRSSLLQCHNWWIPFVLSLLVSLIYGITFSHQVLQFLRSRYQLDVNRLDHEMIRRELHQIRENGIDVGRHGYQGSGFQQLRLEPDKVVWFKIHAYVYFLGAVLLVFSATMLYACHSLLCNHN